MGERSEEPIAVPVVWSGPEEVPILYVNAVVSQFEQTLDAFIVTLGQMTPPALVGASVEELREQAEQLAFVHVKPVARVAFTAEKLREVIAILQTNLGQLERATTMRPGDPR